MAVCILLVEDEALIREIMAETLEDEGYEVVCVEDGQQAIEAIDRHAPFRLLVTDFHMPGSVDGAAVAGHMRTRHPQVPVIIATGRPEVFKSQWRSDHGYTLLRKPYLPSDLISLVDALDKPR